MFSFLLIKCSAVLAALVVVAAASNRREERMSAETCSGAGANPWIYNFMVNGHPAKVLNDATVSNPLEGDLYGATSAVLSRALKRRLLNDTVAGSDNNILYINWDGEGVLFDAGTGPGEAPVLSPGMLVEHLEKEDIPRDSIKHVLITHAHYDHLQGLVEHLESLKPLYPSAKVYMSRVEYDYWTADTVRSHFHAKY
jgi:beta-lactamase superfamily II metal-dependent hydrolase